MTVENLLSPGRHPAIEVSVETGLAQCARSAAENTWRELRGMSDGQLSAETNCLELRCLCACFHRPPAWLAGSPLAGITGWGWLSAGIPGRFSCGIREKPAVKRR